MKTSRQALLLIASLFLVHPGHAAPGDVDLSFDAGSGLNRSPYAIAIQPDGKLLIGGDFTTVAGLMRTRVARLNADGTGDASFNPGVGANEHVRVIALQPDGKALIGGWFTAVDGRPRSRIARLNADGSLDTGFDPGMGANDMIFSVVLQPDGKVLIGGYFTAVNGLARNRIARLNADGSLDASFNLGMGFDGYVYAILLQPDGRVFVGGCFTSFNGVARDGMARLNPDGSLDATFSPSLGHSYFGVECAALQPDGKLLIGGGFTGVNGVPRSNVARLYADGSLDQTFNPGSGPDGAVEHIEVQADGRIVLGGQFYSVNGAKHDALVRLNPNGSIDPGFNPIPGAYAPEVTCLKAQADGTIIVGGHPTIQPGNRDKLARLLPDGRPDLSFNPGTGIGGSLAFSAAALPGGKVLVWGNFTEVANQGRPGIARLQPSGQLDTTFVPPPMVGDFYYQTNAPVVYSKAVLPDGKLLIGGSFTVVAGVSRNHVARLNPDGTFDPSFDPGSGADYSVYQVISAPDGKVLISGNFNHFNGVVRNYVARLNADGSLDPTFAPDISGFGELGLQPDGKILLAGAFTAVNGVARNNVARLDPDGAVDPTFDPGSGADGYVSSVTCLAIGKVLLGGSFANVGGVPRNGLARLNTNGTLDLDFAPQVQPEHFMPGANLAGPYVEQADGKVLIWGGFTNVSGLARPGLARLNLNGSLDATFDPGAGADNIIGSVAVQPDSKILIAGGFSSLDGVPRMALARLLGNEPPVIVSQPASRTNVVGTAASFAVVASGTAPLGYQWFKDGVALVDGGRLSGSLTPTLTIAHVQFQDAGSYTVLVTNAAGSATSAPAFLRVRVPPVARIAVRPLARFPGVTNLLVIAPDGRRAAVVLDGSASTSGSGARLQYQWFEGTSMIATNAITIHWFPVGQYQFSLVVRDGMLDGSASVAVGIIKPSDAARILVREVETSRLAPKEKQPLLATLSAVVSAFDSRRFAVGLNQLEAFCHKVQAQVTRKDPDLAREFIRSAEVISHALR